MNRNARFPFSLLRFICSLFFLVIVFHPLGYAADAGSASSNSWRDRFKDFFLGSPSKKLGIQKNVTQGSQEIAPAETLPDVSVVSSRLPSSKEKLQNMSTNVTYLGPEDLSAHHPLTFQDAIRETEGVTFYDDVGNGRDATVSMRGFKNSRDVTILVDGARVNEVDSQGVTYPLLPSDDLESVQIERGSMSPIYGSGSFAGVVNLTTRKPSEKAFSTFGGLDFSSFNGIRFNEGVSGTLQDKLTPIQGKGSYYFNGGRDESHGFRANGESRIYDYHFKTDYTLPDDRARIHFGIRHVEDDIHNPGELTFQQFQDQENRTNKPLDRRRYKNTNLQWGVDANFLDRRISVSFLETLRLNKSRSLLTTATFTDGDGFNPDTNFVGSKSHAWDHVGQVQYEEQWGFLRSQSLAGVELTSGKTQNIQRDAFGGQIIETTATETDRGVTNSSWALFWRETVTLWDRVIPYVGMRHEFDRARTNDVRTPTDNISRHWNGQTVSTGLTVKPLKFADIFVNYSQGFRVPNGDELAPFSGTIAANLVPEKSNSYEAGTRLRYKDQAAYKFSYFLTDVDQEIVFDSNAISNSAPFGTNINIGRTRRYGIEQRLDFHPLREIDLYGSYTWLRAYVGETSSTNSPVDGRSLGQIPENRFTLGGMLTPFKRWGEPLDGLRLGMDGIFSGRQHPASYESASQTTLNRTGGAGHWIKAYSVWNFILSMNYRKKEIFFKVNNLFNEKYYSRAVNATSSGTNIYPAGTYTFVDQGAPRELVLGTRWEF